MICKKCNVNEFDEWAAKDKGQKFPFKSCFDCREKAKKEREEQGQTFSGGSGEILILLREILSILKGGVTKEKPVGEPPKEKEVDIEDVPF